MSRREEVAKNLAEITKILNGRAKLLAVSKNRPGQDVKTAYETGQRDFGENKLQELASKAQITSSCPEIRWHFIGQLQTNKVNALLKIPGLVSIHSIDSIKLLNKLLSKDPGKPIGLFLQHNTSGEQEKAGFRSFSELLEAALVLQEAQDKEGPKRFYLQGLMTMGSIRTENFEESARECFEQLRSLRDEIEAQTKHSKLELSMGMSQDYEIAIEKGADWVRIGSNIFGSR